MSRIAQGLIRLGFEPLADFTAVEKLDGSVSLAWHRDDVAQPAMSEIDAAGETAASEGLLNRLAHLRWRAEENGTVWNGWPLPTNDRSLLKYAAEVVAVQQGLRSNGEAWKFPHGFEALSNDEVIAMAAAARDHVKACFAAEAAVLAEVEAGRTTTPAEVEAAFAATMP